MILALVGISGSPVGISVFWGSPVRDFGSPVGIAAGFLLSFDQGETGSGQDFGSPVGIPGGFPFSFNLETQGETGSGRDFRLPGRGIRLLGALGRDFGSPVGIPAGFPLSLH